MSNIKIVTDGFGRPKPVKEEELYEYGLGVDGGPLTSGILMESNWLHLGPNEMLNPDYVGVLVSPETPNQMILPQQAIIIYNHGTNYYTWSGENGGALAFFINEQNQAMALGGYFMQRNEDLIGIVNLPLFYTTLTSDVCVPGLDFIIKTSAADGDGDFYIKVFYILVDVPNEAI